MERLPLDLQKHLKNQFNDDLDTILQGFNKEACTTFRVNTLKSTMDDVVKSLDEACIKYEIIDTKGIFKVDGDASLLRKLAIYDEGKIYLQSISSMLPVTFLEPKPNEDILDMAAAPGGKTSQIAALTNNQARITAYEVNKIRAERLKYNLNKLGVKNYTVIENDARNIDSFFRFDQILLDAPCSGTGTIDFANPQSYKSFNEKMLGYTTRCQLKLLEKALEVLKPGGTMVYSTCSILSCENEDIILKALSKRKDVEVVKLQYDSKLLLKCKVDGALVIRPTSDNEGFFICKLRKLSK